MHSEDTFHSLDHPGPMQILLSFKIKVVFCTSGSPKSPGWRGSHPHYQHKPLNEASPCATLINDHHNVPNIDIDDYDCTCPAVATKLAPHLHRDLPRTAHIDIGDDRCCPRLLHTIRVCKWTTQGETGHDDDDNGGGGGNNLMRGELLEQERVEGAHWRAGEIEKEGRMKLGVKGQLESATIVPITIPI
ncbi:hypothetical protein EDD85DRAFT_794102 [Armillaria nabsnona]|nr:hypothetical protein EDD85DRAFT_794102 [Armillaria nabsnona]